MQINSYLTFNGNCREAMEFYKKCLGGELTFQTVGESPRSKKMKKRMKDAILHATLIKDKLIIMASDLVGEKGLLKGNTVSLLLICSSKSEIQKMYNKLSLDGEKTYPLKPTFQGAVFGNLTDKYGTQWLLHYQPVKKSRYFK